MAFLLWHTVGSAKTHNDKEGSHVLPGRFRPMADDDYTASVPSEQAASDRLGPLELRHGAGPLVRPDGGEAYAGQGEEAQTADGPPATAGMAPAVTAAPPSHPAGLDGHRVGRPGFVRSVAVSADHTAGLASIFADQYGGQFSARRGNVLASFPQLGPPARHELAWHGHRFYPQPGALHVVGPLGGGLQRPLADPH